MSATTIPRLADIVKARGDAPLANVPGRWINAGTLVSDPYPCQCWYSPCRYAKCPDLGIAEVPAGWELPPGCCGRALAKRAESPVERSGGTGIPEEGDSALQDRPRHPAAALVCDCQTPWDPPAPLLMIVAGKDGPVESCTSQPMKSRDMRADADKALADMGLTRLRPWKDGRHVLLPPAPGARSKTRPCWSAPLADGKLAVLDTPDETGSGVHCPDCHEDFANAGAWEMHRAKGRYGLGECKDPGKVLAVGYVEIIPAVTDLVGRTRPSAVGHMSHGLPLLRRTIGAVWAVDPLAVWGPQGCPMTRDEISTAWTRAQERLAGRRWKYGRGHNRGSSPVL